jgi:hypothetical protein
VADGGADAHPPREPPAGQTGILTLAFIALSATPAAAGVPNSRCIDGYICFWTGPDFTGVITGYQNPVHNNCGTVTERSPLNVDTLETGS